MPHTDRLRPIGLLDIAASCAASVLPFSWSPQLDQVRLDLRAVLDGIQGHHEVPFRDAHHGPRGSVPLASIDPIEQVLPRHLAARYGALRRDLSMVVDGVAGRHPPPFSRRTPTAARPWGARGSTTAVTLPARSFRVASIERLTRDSITLRLADPAGAPFDFSAGQFITLLVDIAGRAHRRAYSICSDPADRGTFAITIKRVAGGVVSCYLHDHAAEGMTLRALGPSGSFVRPSDQQHDAVLVAAGSGITPVMSVLRVALGHSNARVALLYGNRTEDDIIFARELEALRASHGDRLVIRHVLSRAGEAWTGARGRIDRAALGAFLDTISWSALPDVRFYVCGPEGMMAEVHATLSTRGVDAFRILQERFASPRSAQADAPLSWQPQPMTVLSNAGQRAVQVLPGQTLLEAGLQAGLPFKFSCMMGGCASCKIKLRSGKVHMGEPNALTSSEKDAGHALACIARPVEPVSVELG